MAKNQYYAQPQRKTHFFLNQWDVIILVILFGIFAAMAWGAQHMSKPYELGEAIPITLDPWVLPQYAVSTILRMAIALFFSLLFTFTVGTLAAKSRQAEKFILPFIDIMQSVPILGFLSISILAFIYLFPGSRLGPECAAIFVIFTSQVWNMVLSFYQSLKTIPKELGEASKMFHLSAWQRFWRLEVPFATPSLIWNTMMSLSAGWFFVVASEAISVNDQNIMLPGIGSYIMMATQESDYAAIGYVILAMLLVILSYDQLIFRPLIAWSEKFKLEPNLEVESTGTWFLTIIQRSHITQWISIIQQRFRDWITIKKPTSAKHKRRLSPKMRHALSWTAVTFWNMVLLFSILGSTSLLVMFIYKELTLQEVFQVFQLGLVTTLKVTILIILSSIIWIPVGVWIGLNPKLTKAVQPLAQFLAAFPANLLYPVIFMLIVTYKLNVEIWTAPLMILGTQWYILFNVIAGASAIPLEFRLAAKNYGVKGMLWWRKVILPSIFPYYVTGAMTAAGGCWNASIVADVVNWKGTTIHATGLGAYITEFTTTGDFPRIALGISVMCIYVIVLNRLIWHKLFELSEERYHVG